MNRIQKIMFVIGLLLVIGSIGSYDIDKIDLFSVVIRCVIGFGMVIPYIIELNKPSRNAQ